MYELEQKGLHLDSKSIPKSSTAVLPRTSRLSAIDIQRGLIVILMAFAHSREYLTTEGYTNTKPGVSPKWMGTEWVDLFHQLFVRTVAGGFCMTMGIGIFFLWQARLANHWEPKKIAQYLFTRGSLLIFLQLTVLGFFNFITTGIFYINVGVLMMLGFCMMSAGACMWLIDSVKNKPWAKNSPVDVIMPLAMISVLVLSTQLAMNHIDLQHPSLAQMMLLVGGDYFTTTNFEIQFNFVPVPWLTAVIFGLLVGKIIYKNHQQGMITLQKMVVAMLISWFILRTGLLAGWFTFGDYKIPSSGEQLNWISYFCMSKYPPSFDYFLWVLAINMQGIIIWNKIEHTKPKLMSLFTPLKTFGQCALFFFISHWYVYYGLSLIVGHFTSPAGIFGGWLLGLIVLYPVCRAFRNFKMNKPAESLWRML